MKKTDFQTKDHVIKKSLEYATKINGKDQVLRAVLSQNSQKGTYDVTIKIGIDKVTGDDVLDKAMLKSMADLAFHGIQNCQEFRKAWKTNQPKSGDKNQTELFGTPDKKASSKATAKSSAAKRAAAKRKVKGK